MAVERDAFAGRNSRFRLVVVDGMPCIEQSFTEPKHTYLWHMAPDDHRDALLLRLVERIETLEASIAKAEKTLRKDGRS